jgi:hypothetical protein
MIMPTNKSSENKTSSKGLASQAGKLLANPKTPEKYRPFLGSVIAQAKGKPGK